MHEVDVERTAADGRALREAIARDGRGPAEAAEVLEHGVGVNVEVVGGDVAEGVDAVESVDVSAVGRGAGGVNGLGLKGVGEGWWCCGCEEREEECDDGEE